MASSLCFAFRKAAQRDVPRLTELYMDCFAQWTEKPEMIPAYLSERADDQGWSFIVAEDKPGHIAGFVLVNCGYGESHGIVNVDVMAVDKESRRHGLGKSLMHMSDLVAHNAGAQGVTLQVVEYNEPAKNLYLSLDFNIVGIRPRFYTDGTNALEMLKILPPTFAANDADHPAVQRPQNSRWRLFG